MLCGIPEDLFWRSTLEEIEAIFDRRYDAELAEYERAGLVTAAVYNVHRKKGARRLAASDFYRDGRRRERDFMSVAEATIRLDRWAGAINRGMVDA